MPLFGLNTKTKLQKTTCAKLHKEKKLYNIRQLKTISTLQKNTECKGMLTSKIDSSKWFSVKFFKYLNKVLFN